MQQCAEIFCTTQIMQSSCSSNVMGFSALQHPWTQLQCFMRPQFETQHLRSGLLDVFVWLVHGRWHLSLYALPFACELPTLAPIMDALNKLRCTRIYRLSRFGSDSGHSKLLGVGGDSLLCLG